MDDPPSERPPQGQRPISVRIARLRAYVECYDALDQAAHVLSVRPSTLRINLNRETATHEALDAIIERLPKDWPPPSHFA